ncbi:MAG TPA: uroporphyrinogen-III C-methyltransferase [Phycisphaerae bacterium]|nr:uroporphyrinogen-III C-methyltransferase [Phycisphaerae bacterium]
MTPPGKVYLVGAGPGSPDLITLRGLRALRGASWVIADSLLTGEYLSELGIPARVRLTCLQHGDTRDHHEQILERMARAAEAGEVVVRLKNGDPFLFGRGCEENEFFTSRGIFWEVVPGVSASIAGPTLAAMPLTSRDRGRSFAVVTARCSGGRLNPDYPKADTLIVFMGISVLGEIAARLIEQGWPPETPAAVLSRVSMPWENRCSGTLETIAPMLDDMAIAAPAILVVGVGAAWETELPRRPRILFAGQHPDDFRHLGDVIHWPALVAEPIESARSLLTDCLNDLRRGRYGRVVFADSTTLQIFFQGINDLGGDARSLAGVKVVAADDPVARRLREQGVRPDLILAGRSAEQIARTPEASSGAGILVVGESRQVAGLEQAGLVAGDSLVRLSLLIRRLHPDLGRPLPAHDAIVITSPEEIDAYVQAYGVGVWKAQIWFADDAARITWSEHRRAFDPSAATLTQD